MEIYIGIVEASVLSRTNTLKGLILAKYQITLFRCLPQSCAHNPDVEKLFLNFPSHEDVIVTYITLVFVNCYMDLHHSH